MSNIKYISAQPDELYYAWQVEVMLNNFLFVGISAGDIHILVGINKNIGEWWNKLVEKYEGVGFFFYRDERWSYYKSYPPSIVPFLMYRHYGRFPELQRSIIFHHDCDIVFTRKPDLSKFVDGYDWYFSDTVSYIGASYIKSKGESIYLKMCRIAGINPRIPIDFESDSGGAQHIIKNVDQWFWRDVYINSEKLYSYLCTANSDIQKWTAGMWSLLWTSWITGHRVRVSPDLNFSMATDTWPKWDKNLIYHNAGAVAEHQGKLFIKDQYRDKLPYLNDNPYDRQFCSYKYFDQVIETGKTSCLKDELPNMELLIDQCKSIFINK